MTNERCNPWKLSTFLMIAASLIYVCLLEYETLSAPASSSTSTIRTAKQPTLLLRNQNTKINKAIRYDSVSQSLLCWCAKCGSSSLTKDLFNVISNDPAAAQNLHISGGKDYSTNGWSMHNVEKTKAIEALRKTGFRNPWLDLTAQASFDPLTTTEAVNVFGKAALTQTQAP